MIRKTSYTTLSHGEMFEDPHKILLVALTPCKPFSSVRPRALANCTVCTALIPPQYPLLSAQDLTKKKGYPKYEYEATARVFLEGSIYSTDTLGK